MLVLLFSLLLLVVVVVAVVVAYSMIDYHVSQCPYFCGSEAV